MAIEGIEPKSHRAVRRMFGLTLIKTCKIEKDFARILTREKEDREIGDYEIHIEIERDTAQMRVAEADKFVKRMEEYILNFPTKPK